MGITHGLHADLATGGTLEETGMCWLRKNLDPAKCENHPNYNLHLFMGPKVTPHLPPSNYTAKWDVKSGFNCYEGMGGVPVPGKEQLEGGYTEEGCKDECVRDLKCKAIVRRSSMEKSQCWLRMSVDLQKCFHNP